MLEEALADATLARLDVSTVIHEIVVALGGQMADGGDELLQLRRRLVQRPAALARELVLMGKEAGQESAISG